MVTIAVNGRVLGIVLTDVAGNFTFTIATDSADTGIYIITATAADAVRTMAGSSFIATTQLTLATDAPQRTTENLQTVFDVPAGIGVKAQIYLPALLRS